MDVLGTNRNSQQETASTAVQLLYSDLDCLRSASDALARGFRPVIFWASKTEGGGADSTPTPPPPPPPLSVTPRYESYGSSILHILRSFQFWVYLGKLWVFSGTLSTFFRVYWDTTTPAGRPCKLFHPHFLEPQVFIARSWHRPFCMLMKRIFIITQTTFQDCCVDFALFSNKLSRNSCIQIEESVVDPIGGRATLKGSGGGDLEE